MNKGSSDNEEFNSATFLNVVNKVQEEKAVDTNKSFKKEVTEEPEKGIEEQTVPVEPKVQSKNIHGVKKVDKNTSIQPEVKKGQVKTKTSEHLSQLKPTCITEINSQEDFKIVQNPTETKTKSIVSSTSSSDESINEVIFPPPLKPFSETDKAMIIRQSVLYGEAKHVDTMSDLNKKKRFLKK